MGAASTFWLQSLVLRQIKCGWERFDVTWILYQNHNATAAPNTFSSQMFVIERTVSSNQAHHSLPRPHPGRSEKWQCFPHEQKLGMCHQNPCNAKNDHDFQGPSWIFKCKTSETQLRPELSEPNPLALSPG